MPDPSNTKSHKVAMPAGPISLHKRLASGETVTGQEKNPNGGMPSTKSKVGNAKVTY